MPRYRKLPIIVEAFQLTHETRWDNRDWPEWLNEAWNRDNLSVGAMYPAEHGDPDDLFINTLEGVHRVSSNGWIIQGVQKELYPCLPDIFKKLYEEA